MMSMVGKLVVNLISRASRLWFELMKILVPLVILIEMASWLGAVALLERTLAPVMALVGLPAEAALIWATTLLTNLYGGMLVFANLADSSTFTVAQATTLTSMMLIAHALPVEVAICKRAGASAWFCLALRVFGALLYGMVVHLVSDAFGWGSSPAAILWQPTPPEPGLVAWVAGQAKQFAWIWLIVVALLLVLDLLKAIGVYRMLEQLLVPLLRPLQLNRTATPILVTGLTLGITYGGALLIEAGTEGSIDIRDTTLAIGFLCLCHSIIEDTLLMILMGGAVPGILAGRFVFAFLIMMLLARAYLPAPEPQN